MIGAASQGTLTIYELENAKRGWQWNEGKNRWETKLTQGTYERWLASREPDFVGPPLPPEDPPLRHTIIGQNGLELLRNYGFVSPILHSVQSQWAEAGIIAAIGIQPWAAEILDKLGDLERDFRPDDLGDFALGSLGAGGYFLGKYLRNQK